MTAYQRSKQQFKADLKRGERFEDALDRVFGAWYDIKPASDEWQRYGVDRIFFSPDGRRYTVEYKADDAAGRTRNAFIETVSVDTTNKPGWALTCVSQLIMLYVPTLAYVLVVDAPKLKRTVTDWAKRYPVKKCRVNVTYNSLGLLVPLSVVENEVSLKRLEVDS